MSSRTADFFSCLAVSRPCARWVQNEGWGEPQKTEDGANMRVRWMRRTGTQSTDRLGGCGAPGRGQTGGFGGLGTPHRTERSRKWHPTRTEPKGARHENGAKRGASRERSQKGRATQRSQKEPTARARTQALASRKSRRLSDFCMCGCTAMRSRKRWSAACRRSMNDELKRSRYSVVHTDQGMRTRSNVGVGAVRYVLAAAHPRPRPRPHPSPSHPRPRPAPARVTASAHVPMRCLSGSGGTM